MSKERRGLNAESLGDSSSNEVVLVYIVIVPLLLILSLSTSTAILAIYVLKVKKRKSNHRVISKPHNKDRQKSVNVSAPSISRDQECKTSILCKIASVSRKNKTSVLSMHDVDCQEISVHKHADKNQKGVRKKNKATSPSLSDVVCKENESYGGVAAGYKVIREVALSLQEMSDSSSVCVSPNQAYKLSRTAKHEDP